VVHIRGGSDGLRSFGARQAVIVHPEGFSDSTGSDDWSDQSWNGGGSSGANAGGGLEGPICNPAGLKKYGHKCYQVCVFFPHYESLLVWGLTPPPMQVEIHLHGCMDRLSAPPPLPMQVQGHGYPIGCLVARVLLHFK
jgi:hypothetical protein